MLASGASNASMGEAAEAWTSSELRRMHRKGWRHLDHLTLRPPGDIDHVAVGPDGVIVIETKWRSIATDLSRDSKWLSDAAKQVRRNQRDLAGHLGWGARQGARITSLLVVWGPEITQQGDGPQDGPDGVNVVAGRYLRTVLGDLSETLLDAEESEAVYRKLAEQMDRADQWTEANRSEWPLTLSEVANAWMARTLAGFGSTFLSLFSLGLGWWALPALLAVAAVPLLVRRFRVASRWDWTRWWTGWWFGLGAALCLLFGAVAVQVAST